LYYYLSYIQHRLNASFSTSHNLIQTLEDPIWTCVEDGIIMPYFGQSFLGEEDAICISELIVEPIFGSCVISAMKYEQRRETYLVLKETLYHPSPPI